MHGTYSNDISDLVEIQLLSTTEIAHFPPLHHNILLHLIFETIFR